MVLWYLGENNYSATGRQNFYHEETCGDLNLFRIVKQVNIYFSLV